MPFVLDEREADTIHLPAPEPDGRQGTAAPEALVHVLLATLTLHLIVTVTVSDLSGIGKAVGASLALACGLGAAWLYDHGGRLARVSLCAAAAVIGVAQSVGVGLNKVARVGFSAGDVLAVAALVASIGLGGLAVEQAIAGRNWRAKTLAVPIVLMFVYYVIVPVTLGVWATHTVAEERTGRDPGDLGLVFEDVRLQAEDGTPLAGWYVASRNGAAIIVRHGANSSREAVLDHVGALAAAGYGVLAMDARGHGESGGESNAFGWYAQDISVGVDHLLGHAEVRDDAIGVLGLSMGAEEAITAAAADPRLQAVVAEGATMRTTADFLAIDKGVAMWVSLPHYWAMYTTADVLSGAAPPPPLVDAIAAIAPRPVLLIAAGDVDEEQRFGERFVDAAPASTHLWVVSGAGHTKGLQTDPTEWTARVIAFLDGALDRGPTK